MLRKYCRAIFLWRKFVRRLRSHTKGQREWRPLQLSSGMHVLLPWVGLGFAALLLMVAPADVFGPADATMAGTVLVAPIRRRRGRPRKFDEPTRVVSLTLPESVIASLTDLHCDLGHAVTRLARKIGKHVPGRRPAELVMFGRRATISVLPSRTLARRWLMACYTT